jgi:hypothetical protein
MRKRIQSWIQCNDKNNILKLIFFLGDASSKIKSQNNRCQCLKNPYAVHKDSSQQLQVQQVCAQNHKVLFFVINTFQHLSFINPETIIQGIKKKKIA